jgi:hypothetical protein
VPFSKLHIFLTLVALFTLGKAPLVTPLRNPDQQMVVRMSVTRDPDA